jgi:steroid delta-isomerase-like uncharacterized protein
MYDASRGISALLRKPYSPTYVEEEFSEVRTSLREVASCFLGGKGLPALGERVRKEETAMSEENKALARRAWEAVKNPDLLDEVYAPDVVWHEPDQELRGLEQAKQFVTTYRTALPDLNITVEDQIAEGDKVVTRVTLRGTHQGETEEFGPPTGSQIEGEGVTISRIEGGKIVEDWDSYDNLSFLQQLGLVPEQ